MEYEYNVDAVHGTILQAEHDASGSGYDDTDYGPNNDGVTDYDDDNDDDDDDGDDD